MPSLHFTEPVALVLVNTTQRVGFSLLDDNGNLFDPVSISLTVYDSGQAVMLQTGYPVTGFRVKRASIGVYYIDWGTALPNNETNMTAAFYFAWTVLPTTGADYLNEVQMVRTVSVKSLGMIHALKLQVDKAEKTIVLDSGGSALVGYTTPMLLQFLNAGLQYMNAFQPYPTWNSIDDFPEIHQQILIDAATIATLGCQELYAIDTDIPQYSDNGNQLVLQHQPQLAAYVNALWARLEKLIPAMKLHYVSTGAIHIEMGPNFRLSTLMNAAPAGSIFRGIFAV